MKYYKVSRFHLGFSFYRNLNLCSLCFVKESQVKSRNAFIVLSHAICKINFSFFKNKMWKLNQLFNLITCFTVSVVACRHDFLKSFLHFSLFVWMIYCVYLPFGFKDSLKMPCFKIFESVSFFAGLKHTT